MKKYSVPFGRLRDWNHPHPDRTAYKCGRGTLDDCICQVFSNRTAMLVACDMSQDSEHVWNRLHPLIKDVISPTRFRHSA